MTTAILKADPTANLVVVPNVYYLPTDRIEPNPFQPRQHFGEAELEEIAASIREHGLLQPILVRPHPEKEGWFQLVSGERRWRACVMIERAQIQGTVRNLTDLETAKFGLQENIQRQSLSDWEEARGIEKLWAAYERAGQPMSKRAMAKELSMSISYVSNRLDALGYHGDVQEVLGRSRGILSSAKIINHIDDETRRVGYLDMVVQGGSFLDVKAAIQRDDAEIAAKAQASRAPDAQTGRRSRAVERGESGSVSRGRQLTGGTSKAEANAETLRHVRGLEAWVTHCDQKTYDQALDLARRIVRGDLKR